MNCSKNFSLSVSCFCETNGRTKLKKNGPSWFVSPGIREETHGEISGESVGEALSEKHDVVVQKSAVCVENTHLFRSRLDNVPVAVPNWNKNIPPFCLTKFWAWNKMQKAWTFSPRKTNKQTQTSGCTHTRTWWPFRKIIASGCFSCQQLLLIAYEDVLCHFRSGNSCRSVSDASDNGQDTNSLFVLNLKRRVYACFALAPKSVWGSLNGLSIGLFAIHICLQFLNCQISIAQDIFHSMHGCNGSIFLVNWSLRRRCSFFLFAKPKKFTKTQYKQIHCIFTYFIPF